MGLAEITIEETTDAADAAEARRRFIVQRGDDHAIHLSAVHMDGRWLEGDAPTLQVAGSIATNEQVAHALLQLAAVLVRTPGRELPKS